MQFGQAEREKCPGMSGRILLAATMGWPSVARYAGAFASSGCTVAALSPRKAPVALSRYVSEHFTYRPLAAMASLKAAVAAFTPDLIVPCDDRATAQLLKLRKGASVELAALIDRSLGTPENYTRIMSRNNFMAEAKAIGVRVPLTFPVTSEAELDACLAEVGFPAVVKADGSWGGDGVIVAKTREEARSALRKLSQAPSRLRSFVRAFRRKDAHYILEALKPSTRAVSVQRFIPGKPAASAFAAWNGEIVGAVWYDMLETDGPMGPPNVIRRVDCPEIAEASRLVAKHFGLSGLHGMDFIRDADGHVHLLEINPRATQGGTLGFGPGRDAPAALATCVKPDAVHPTGIKNDVVVIFPREWQRDPSSPYLASAHHDVPWDDPAVLRASLGEAPKTRAAAGIVRALSARLRVLAGRRPYPALP